MNRKDLMNYIFKQLVMDLYFETESTDLRGFLNWKDKRWDFVSWYAMRTLYPWPNKGLSVKLKKKPDKYKVVERFYRDEEGKKHTFRDIIPIYNNKGK